MKCKIGDIAIIKTGNRRLNGLLVEVVDRAKPRTFQMPNGRYHEGTTYEWLVKSLSGPVTASVNGSLAWETNYFAAPDRALFPLRDLFEENEAALTTLEA